MNEDLMKFEGASPALAEAWKNVWESTDGFPDVVRIGIHILQDQDVPQIMTKAQENLTTIDKEQAEHAEPLRLLRLEAFRSLDRLHFYREIMKLDNADREAVLPLLSKYYEGEFEKGSVVILLTYECLHSALLYHLVEHRFPNEPPDNWFTDYAHATHVRHRNLVAALRKGLESTEVTFERCLKSLMDDLQNELVGDQRQSA